MSILSRSTFFWKIVLIFSVILKHIVVPTVSSAQSVWVEHVAWHSNIIAVADSEDIWLYNDVTLQEVAFIDRTVGLMDMEWNSTGTHLAFSSGDGFTIELAVWDFTTQQYEWQITVNKSYSYAGLPIQWSPDGQYLALGLYEELHIYDGNTGSLVQTLSGFGIEEVAGIAWNPTGDRLVTTTVKTLKAWDTATWNLIAVLAEDTNFWSVEWITGTSQIAVVHDYNIEIWDISSLQLVTTLVS